MIYKAPKSEWTESGRVKPRCVFCFVKVLPHSLLVTIMLQLVYLCIWRQHISELGLSMRLSCIIVFAGVVLVLLCVKDSAVSLLISWYFSGLRIGLAGWSLLTVPFVVNNPPITFHSFIINCCVAQLCEAMKQVFAGDEMSLFIKLWELLLTPFFAQLTDVYSY